MTQQYLQSWWLAKCWDIEAYYQTVNFYDDDDDDNDNDDDNDDDADDNDEDDDADNDADNDILAQSWGLILSNSNQNYNFSSLNQWKRT